MITESKPITETIPSPPSIPEIPDVNAQQEVSWLEKQILAEKLKILTFKREGREKFVSYSKWAIPGYAGAIVVLIAIQLFCRKKLQSAEFVAVVASLNISVVTVFVSVVRYFFSAIEEQNK